MKLFCRVGTRPPTRFLFHALICGVPWRSCVFQFQKFALVGNKARPHFKISVFVLEPLPPSYLVPFLGFSESKSLNANLITVTASQPPPSPPSPWDTTSQLIFISLRTPTCLEHVSQPGQRGTSRGHPGFKAYDSAAMTYAYTFIFVAKKPPPHKFTWLAKQTVFAAYRLSPAPWDQYLRETWC